MANNIGINIRVDADTSGLKKAGPDFDEALKKVQAITGISDDGQLLEYMEKVNESVENRIEFEKEYNRIMTARRLNEGRSGGGGRDSGGGDDRDNGGRVIPFPGRGIFTAERAIRGFASQAPNDALGAGLSVGQSLIEGVMKSISALPTAAKIAVGAGAGIVGAGLLGNTLSKQYEAVVPDLIQVTAALKRFGATADEQGKLFSSTMSEISGTSSKWNYTFQQGASAITQIARMGGGASFSRESTLASADSVMRISRSLGYSTPMSALTELAGYASGYGQFGAEKYALGAATRTTGSQTTEEVAGAMQAILGNVFENGGSMTPEKAANTQKWLYDIFGKRAGGAGGAAAFSSLSGSVRGATGLKSETDLLLFQAARDLSGGDNMQAMMMMEQGFSPELFNKFKGSISGASDWDKIYLTSKAFGVNKTIAKQMIDGTYKGDVSAMKELSDGSNINATPEAGIAGVQERIAQRLREVGDEALNIKYAILSLGDRVVSAILHPESAEFGGMAAPNNKGNTGINKAEATKPFASLMLAGSPVAGFGGNALDESYFWAEERFGRNKEGQEKGIKTLAFLTEALHSDSFMSKVSADKLKEWTAMDSVDKSTSWSASEATNLYNSVMAEAVRQGTIGEIIKALKEVNITIQIPATN